MSEILAQAVDICRKLIGEKTTPDVSEIDSAITNITYIPMFKDVDQSILKDMLLSLYTTKVDTFQILEGKERRDPWLKAFKAAQSSKWNFWTRYSKYLAEKKSFAPSVISHLDELTDKVLDKLFNPQRDDIIISKKGLVVGQVQSGKTANYTGLVCKAADAGFNLIIVLAGIHNNLRSQTQTRLDEGFLGFDTQNTRAFTLNQTIKMGVGRIPGFDDAIAHSYTTSLDTGDFTKRAANTAGFNFHVPQPIVLVVKKNSSVLKNLRDWLKTHTIDGKIANKSMLLIDDEADNASINTNKADKNPTRINGYIRDIISLFNRSAYVGYTATPFANIFIPLDDSDLFPRDFIINLPAPDNYIGPEKVFGTSIIPDEDDELLPIVNTVDDSDDFVPPKHRKDDDMPSIYDMPQSLKTAIKCFIMTCAIRAARGQEKKHNSMLIHITRFQSWQNHIKDIVEQQFRYYKSEIEANDPAIMEEFHKIFEGDTESYKSYWSTTKEILDSKSFGKIDSQIRLHTWEEVKPFLYPAVQKIEVKSINGSSGDSLTYYENEKNGISVIAIGGDKLSRGLTLEGLSVSYFLRASKMYDTLMQMGRWFGYRPGYVDLCRLFTILLSIIRTNSRIAHLASGVCNLAYPPSVDYIIGQIFTSHFILAFPSRIAGSEKDYIKNEQRNCHEYQNPGDSEHRIGSQYHISTTPCNLFSAFGCGTAYLIPGITDEGKHGYAHQPADYRLTVRTPELRQYGNHTQHSTYPIITIRLRHNVHSGHLTEMLGDETVPFRKRQDDRHKRQDDKQQQTAEQTCQVYRYVVEQSPPFRFPVFRTTATHDTAYHAPNRIHQRQRYKRTCKPIHLCIRRRLIYKKPHAAKQTHHHHYKPQHPGYNQCAERTEAE